MLSAPTSFSGRAPGGPSKVTAAVISRQPSSAPAGSVSTAVTLLRDRISSGGGSGSGGSTSPPILGHRDQLVGDRVNFVHLLDDLGAGLIQTLGERDQLGVIGHPALPSALFDPATAGLGHLVARLAVRS